MAQFALSWNRSEFWQEKLGKRQSRGISSYLSADYQQVEATAIHINSLNPEMACKVEVFT